MIWKFIEPMRSDQTRAELRQSAYSNGEMIVWTDGALAMRFPTDLAPGWYQRDHVKCWEKFGTLPKTGRTPHMPSHPGSDLETLGDRIMAVIDTEEGKPLAHPPVLLNAELLLRLSQAMVANCPVSPPVLKLWAGVMSDDDPYSRSQIRCTMGVDGEPFAALMPMRPPEFGVCSRATEIKVTINPAEGEV